MDLITYALCKNSGASDAAASAAQSASSAAQSATDASGYASAASSSATAAAGSATTAQGHAQAAQQAAQTAQDAAQALSGIGAEAQTLPPGSDATVTVQDGKIIYGIPAGQPGTPAEDGKSAYEIAVENGFQGTEEQWLASLKAPDDYNQLKSLPKINGVEVKGELTSQNLKIENFNPYLISSLGLMNLIISGVGDGDYFVVDNLLGGVNNFKQAVMDNRLILIIPDGDIFGIRLFDIARLIQIEANKISFVVGNFNIEIRDDGENVTSFTATQSNAISYESLTNKPQINGVTLVGSQTTNSLNIKTSYTASDILFSDGESLQYKFDNKTLVVQ